MSQTEFDAAFERGRESVAIQPGEIVTLRAGCEVHETERFQNAPNRMRGAAVATNVPSFVDLIGWLGNPAAALVFLTPEAATKATAVLNLGSMDEPQWGDLRVKFEPQESDSLKRWRSVLDRDVTQVMLAEFIEDQAHVIISPDSATMLEVVTQLKATRKVDFGSAVSLTNGDVEFKYTSETTAKVAKGSMLVPESFQIRLQPWVGSGHEDFTVRLGYRINEEGRLTFKIRIPGLTDRLLSIVEDEVATTLNSDDIDMVYGTPPDVR